MNLCKDTPPLDTVATCSSSRIYEYRRTPKLWTSSAHGGNATLSRVRDEVLSSPGWSKPHNHSVLPQLCQMPGGCLPDYIVVGVYVCCVLASLRFGEDTSVPKRLKHIKLFTTKMNVVLLFLGWGDTCGGIVFMGSKLVLCLILGLWNPRQLVCLLLDSFAGETSKKPARGMK